MKISDVKIVVCALAFLLPVACRSPWLTHDSGLPPASPGQTLLEQGKMREAAERLEADAQQAKPKERPGLLALAAFAWHAASDDGHARSLAFDIDPHALHGIEHQYFSLLSAEWALAEQKPRIALEQVATAPPSALPSAMQTRWIMVRARAQEAMGDRLAAAQTRALAANTLTAAEQLANQQKIDALLQSLDNATIQQQAAALPAGNPLYNSLAQILLSRNLPLPRPLDNTQPTVMTERPHTTEADGYHPPSRVAALLPLTGALAPVAASVRDGLLASYYAYGQQKPEIIFLDTLGTANGARIAYANAQASHADFVIGPLGRDEVTGLLELPTHPIPLLALNRPTGQQPLPSGLLTFSLAPEDDGIAAADYLLAHHLNQVLVIASSDDSGQRTAKAFAEHLTEAGGKVLQTLTVSGRPSDLHEPLRQYSPHADALFLAARGSTVRSLTPQLASQGLTDKPRIASSQLILGTGNPEVDSVLDGIIFPTNTWSTNAIGSLPSVTQVGTMLPSARGAAARLFAFGFDAWTLCAYLDKLNGHSNQTLTGATGQLHLDEHGRIQRIPTWATFRQGVSTSFEAN